MKGAGLSSRGHGGRAGSLFRAVLISLSPPRWRKRWWGLRSGGAIPCGPSGGQGASGACRSKGLVAGKHLPDCVGEAAGEVDAGDFRSALFAEPLLGSVVAGFVERVAAGVVGRLDQRPAQVAGSL